MKIIAKHKRASFDYHLMERFEAGIILKGTEVKSLRAGKVSLSESFVEIDSYGEAWILNMNIPHYEFGNVHNHEESRKRKLLLSKKEIADLSHRLKAQGLSLIPTIIYFKDSLVKIELALGKGKKLHDKRESEAKKDVERKIRQGKYD